MPLACTMSTTGIEFWECFFPVRIIDQVFPDPTTRKDTGNHSTINISHKIVLAVFMVYKRVGKPTTVEMQTFFHFPLSEGVLQLERWSTATGQSPKAG